MKYILPIFIVFELFSSKIYSQTQLSGIINSYTSVTEIDYCDNKIIVTNPQNFNVGENVLIIQMKGATIDESNSSSFGEVTDIGGAGLHEKASIIDIQGNEIYFKHLLINQYDISGLVQMITYPKYENAIISNTLTAKAWDGQTGGILVFEVENDLSLEDSINVSGKGFRGGQVNAIPSDCNFLTFANNYFYDPDNWRGSPKGEGVAAFIPNKENGRGRQANGGGGGNDHNSGGGGGGGANEGGQGGDQSASGFSCNGNYPGKGGQVPYFPVYRIYLAGGGGSGHVNNAGFGSSGGNGAGVIIIKAKNFIGNDQIIIANGETPLLALADGAGGGGGGGTVILEVENFISEPKIQVKGANGGNISSDADRCYGPGGGGGGGLILYSSPLNITNLNIEAGQAGENLIVASQCDGPSNGATSGAVGTHSSFNAPLPQGTEVFVPLSIIQQPENQSLCPNDSVFYEFLVSGSNIHYQWQINTGNGYEDLQNSQNINGVENASIEFFNIENDLNGSSIRCLAFNVCDTTISSEIVLNIQSNPVADFIFSINGMEVNFTNLSSNYDSILWTFGDGGFSNEISPTHTYIVEDQYEITLKVYNDCDSSIFIQQVSLFQLATPDFSANQTEGCAPMTVQFSDLSIVNNITDWEWTFEGGSPTTSNQQNPIIEYHTPGLYPVKLVLKNQAGEAEVIKEEFIYVEVFPNANFEFEINDLTVIFTNTSIGGLEFEWDFGDGHFSNEEHPVHTFEAYEVFQITLSVTSFSCGSTLEQTLLLMPDATIEQKNEQKIKIFPNPVSQTLYFELGEDLLNDLELTIFSSKGLIIRQLQLISKSISIDNLPSGVYWIQLKNQEINQVKKLIIN